MDDASPHTFSKLPAPVIVAGMHRTGTSLVARLLHFFQVFLGADVEEHFESRAFRRINDLLLGFAHAYWDQPTGFKHLLRDEAALHHAQAHLVDLLNHKSLHTAFFGSTLSSPGALWGWKDPRTSITLPLWRTLFPHAKIIVVHRHGIDVAASLVAREREVLHTKGSDAFLPHTQPYFSVRCLSLRAAFHLWEEYNGFLAEALAPEDPSLLLHVHYETLVTEPEKALHALAHFLDTPMLTEESAAAFIATLEQNRVHAWKQDAKLRRFAEEAGITDS